MKSTGLGKERRGQRLKEGDLLVIKEKNDSAVGDGNEKSKH